MSAGELDAEWFKKQLDRVGKSQNALGKFLGIGGSQASRMMSGQRKLRFDEVPKVARFLSVSVEDVLEHAGLPVATKGLAPIQATEVVDGNSTVKGAHDPIALPTDLEEKIRGIIPFDKTDDVTAALIVAPAGALSIWNDQVVVYEKFSGKPPEMGTLSMARLRDGVQVMGKVLSASKTGDVTLEMAGGEKRAVKIEAIAKVIGVLQ